MNCLFIPLAKLLKSGFNTGHGTVREPQSIHTAANLACIVLQSNQNEMFGGQAFPTFDYDLAPYVAKSFVNHLRECLNDYYDVSDFDTVLHHEITDKIYQKNKTILNDTSKSELRQLLSAVPSKLFEKMYNRALVKTDKETFQAMEALIHNFNTMHSRAGAQTPFSSINYGTDTSEEGRMIVKNVLLATQKGLGRSETPIFPVQIFKIKESVNLNPNSKNYDLFKLAIKTSAKRLFPNFTFCDSPYNAQYYKEAHPETEIAVMGCADKNEKITFIYKDTMYDLSFIDAFNFLKDEFGVYKKTEKSEYVKLDNVLIKDNGSFVKCKGILRNLNVSNWVEVKTDSKTLILTDDHPLDIKDKGRTFVKDIKLNDEIYLVEEKTSEKIKSIIKLERTADSFDVETESDTFDLSGVHSHNCRTRVIGNVYDPEHQQVTGRGNFSFNTLNLPRLGILAKGDLKKFFNDFDNLIDDAIQQLKDRFEYIGKKHVYNFPFLMGQGLYLDSDKYNMNDEIKEILKQSSISVGFCGLAECLVALTGKHHGESEEAQELGLKIIQHLRDRMDEESKKTGLSWSCFATPAESTAGTFLRKDRKIFGVIPGVTDRDYYTNSFHVPVYYNTSISHKIDIESPYHEICNAGSISYIELDGDPNKNLDAYEAIVRYAAKKNLQYFSINTQNDQCPICGYLGVIGDTCPKCGFSEKDGVSIEHLKECGCYNDVKKYNEIIE